MGEAAPDVGQQVRRAQVTMLYERSRAQLIGGVFTGVVMAVLLAGPLGLGRALGWAALKIGLDLLRLFEGWRFERDATRDARIERWYRRYVVLAVADGLVWGGMVALFVPTGSAWLDMVLRSVQLGVAAVGVLTVLGESRTSALFLLAHFVPPMLKAVLVGDAGNGWAVPLLYALYIAMMMIEARRAEVDIVELLRLRHRNDWVVRAQRHALELAHESSQARTRFLASVSHELRTPLHGILGTTQLLQDDPERTPQQQRRLQVIDESARHLHRLIEDVLDLASIDAGRFRLNPEPFSPRVLAEGVASMFAPMAAAKGLSFDVQGLEDLPGSCHADGARIRQVLHNLLGNAVKYTRQGRVTLELRHAGERLHVRVRDTGPGIAPAFLPRLFEPFERAGHASERDEGTGLGLPIARGLARQLGGDLRCNTSPQGTTFEFDARCPPLQAHAPEAPREAPTFDDLEAHGRRVLLVEDNDVNALVATEMLAQWKWTVVRVADGQAALDALAVQSFDLVLMDWHLPVLDGLEATRRWRREEARRRALGEAVRPALPIVALTAHAAADDRQICIDAGMDGFLTKPFTSEALARVVRAVTEETTLPGALGPR